MGIANQKAAIDTHTKEKNQPKPNTKDDHQTTREKKEKRPTKQNPKQLRKWQ